MSIWRRRRKSVLFAVALVLLGGVALLQALRHRNAKYDPEEKTEGITDQYRGSDPAEHPAVLFTDVAREAGIEFAHFPSTRTTRLPEDMGSGVALGDIDGDGWTDAFLVNLAGSLDDDLTAPTAGRSKLFRNRGDGTFADVTAESGIDLAVMGHAAAFADVDSDLDLDLFVTSYGTCHLFLNDGAGHFTDGSAAAGLPAHVGFWTGVAVGDYDQDGALDLYVCGYVVFDEEGRATHGETSQYDKTIPAMLNPSSFDPERNLLLAGNGDGTFRDVTEAAGVENREGRSLSALFCDLNADGRPDLYVANDISDNAFFVNLGDGTFADRAHDALVADYRGAMGLAAGDFDGDLDLDIYVTHWVAQENGLYSQRPRLGEQGDGPPIPMFQDEADLYGIGHAALDRVGWATRFFDFDNDGRLDLFVVNGSTIPLRNDPTKLEPMRSQLFWRTPSKKRFYDVGAVCGAFFGEKHVGRGGATFDFDLDGDEDLLLSLYGENPVLLRNDGGNAKRSLRLRLRQPTGNRFAIGTTITLTVGERRAFDILGSQGSYLSQHAVGETSFGLGDAEEVQRIDLVWPDGTAESGGPFPANSLVTWVRGEGPKAEPFPGRRRLDSGKPKDVEDQKRFWAVHRIAEKARIANDLETAVAQYRLALAIWPGHGDSLYYLGNCLAELGDEAGALEAFTLLVWFEDTSSNGWMQIGLLRLPGGDPSLDDLAAAEAAFQAAYAINSEQSGPVLQLGIAAMLAGRHAEAAKRLTSASRMNPRSVEARWFGGRVAWLRGDAATAETLLREAHTLAVASAPPSASVSNEGDTKAGGAMTARGGVALSPLLTRWRTLATRTPDPAVEYAEDE